MEKRSHVRGSFALMVKHMPGFSSWMQFELNVISEKRSGNDDDAVIEQSPRILPDPVLQSSGYAISQLLSDVWDIFKFGNTVRNTLQISQSVRCASQL